MHSLTRFARTPFLSPDPAVTLPLTLVLALSLVGGLAPLSAQDAPEGRDARSGFHLSVGVGAASVSASCTGCDIDFVDDRTSGFSGRLELGAVVTPRLVVAGEFLGWISNDEVLNRRIAAVSVILLGYPSEVSGLFLKAGFGGLRAVVENNALVFQSDALLGSAGLGYDIPTSSRTSLTPYATYVYTFNTRTTVNDMISAVPVSPNAVQIGIAFTVH